MENTTNQITSSAAPVLNGTHKELTLKIAGKAIGYRAEADWMILRKKEKPVAEMFYVSYLTRDKKRPLTFVFNGGPGASSAYLHMGALGPNRVVFNETGGMLKAPTQITENQESWLAFTDLVFVDPIGTGFSRERDEKKEDAKAEAKPGKDDKNGETKEFYQVNRDLESLGEFMSKFLSKTGRWSSPVYIAGESYGGYRVGRLARKLQEGFGIGLSGAILISPALEISLLYGNDYNLAMWADVFPSLVATSVYHKKSQEGADFSAMREKVEKFATSDLLHLMAGQLNGETRAKLVAQTARYLGLPPQLVDVRDGRIGLATYSRELLRAERKVLGVYDASITATDPFPDRETYQGADPTLYSIERAFTTGINIQLRETLELKTERDYHLISMDVNESWKLDGKHDAFAPSPGASDDLRYAMALNPFMKVWLVHGLFDLVTPYFSSQRIVGLMKLTDEQRKMIALETFYGGHMFYAWERSRREFTASATKFYT